MSTDLEHALRRALDATGAIITEPTEGLAARARQGHRRRAAFRANAGAAIAVAVVVTGVYGLTRAGSPDRTVVSGTATRSASPIVLGVTLDPARAGPVQAVWPQALRTLPARLPNGSDYSPLEEVSDGVFVVQAKNGFERYGSVYRYQPGTGELTLLIDAQRLNPDTTRIAPVGKAWVVNGGGYVAVQTLEAYGEPSVMYVASVADGTRVAETTVPGAAGEIGFPAWVQGHIVWSGPDALYSALDPGRPVPGSAGYRLIGQGAWAIQDSPPGIRWWNVATGERHQATSGDAAGCYATTCLAGAGPAARSSTYQVVGFGGVTGTVELVRAVSLGLGSWGDHFAVVTYGADDDPNRVALLCDLRTLKYAKMPNEDPRKTAGTDMNLLVLTDSGSSKVVINLTAIR